MSPFFARVLKTLEEGGYPYFLGADSLVGLTEGDPLKYSHHLKIYMFPISMAQRFRLFLSLFRQRIIMKPKWEQGNIFYKLRSRLDPLKKDATHVRILPILHNQDAYSVYLGGQFTQFQASHVSPEHLSTLDLGDMKVSVPANLNGFVERYRQELMAGFYQKHVVAFDSESERQAVSFMHENIAIMRQAGITFWIEGGTLLGALRDQKLIPWDHDLDFGMIYRSEDEMQDLIRKLRRRFHVSVRDFPNTEAIWQLGKYRVLKIFPRKYYFLKEDLCLDLFVYYKGSLPGSDEEVYKYVVWDRNAFHRKEFLERPEELEFYGGSVPVPAQPEKFIEVKYGKDWRTPVKEWNVALDDGSIYRA